MPALARAVPLGIQHVLAMFVGNVTPAIIVAGAAGFGCGTPGVPDLVDMIRMSMLFAGVAMPVQTVGIGPVGARPPIVQGTRFVFLPNMIPLLAGKRVDATAAVMGGVIAGGLFHATPGLFIGRLRFARPPLVTGLVVVMIGPGPLRVGIQCAAAAGLFGALPDTSFSQNVGLIAMTGPMSRHVVTCGAVFLILCGLAPKVGVAISTVPMTVLGGGVIAMFGMVVAAGVSMLSDVTSNRRNMVIFAVSLSLGLGLQLEPGALQHLPDTITVPLSLGLLPAAFLAILRNLALPEEVAQEQTEEISGGMAGHAAE